MEAKVISPYTGVIGDMMTMAEPLLALAAQEMCKIFPHLNGFRLARFEMHVGSVLFRRVRVCCESLVWILENGIDSQNT